MLTDTAKSILKKNYICDHCLGRQFAQILSGFTNEERGKAIRTLLAMEYAIKPFDISTSNFYGYDLRKNLKTKQLKCHLCNNLFDDIGRYAKEAEIELKKIDFETFLVGSRISSELTKREEHLWEDIGIEYCEPIKSELNRELGKLIEKAGRKFDKTNPHMLVILNLKNNKIEIVINPVYIYGRYQKLARGIPQTKWEKYKETIEDIIAKPFMKTTKGSEHALHGMGREDIDARCLDWRPFILEISNPKSRKIDLKKTAKEINISKKVKVNFLRFSDKKEVIRLKEAKPDKTYRALAEFDRGVDNIDSVKKIIGIIKQQTPKRVLHRRADKIRNRRVKSIRWRRIKNNIYEFVIKAEAGLYVKELITGDNGRTKPSVSEILKNPSKIKELDVIRIHLKAR